MPDHQPCPEEPSLSPLTAPCAYLTLNPSNPRLRPCRPASLGRKSAAIARCSWPRSHEWLILRISAQTFVCADVAVEIPTSARVQSRAWHVCMLGATRKRGGTQGAHIALLDPSPPARRSSESTSWTCGAAPTSRPTPPPPPTPPRRAAAGPRLGLICYMLCVVASGPHVRFSPSQTLILGAIVPPCSSRN